MPFLKISNMDVLFDEKTLTWRIFTTNEALSTTKQVQIVDLKKFFTVALDVNSKTFVVHVAIQEREKTPVHSKRQVQVEALLFDKASTKVPAKYSNYSNVISAENTAKLLENTGINEYAIELEENK